MRAHSYTSPHGEATHPSRRQRSAPAPLAGEGTARAGGSGCGGLGRSGGDRADEPAGSTARRGAGGHRRRHHQRRCDLAVAGGHRVSRRRPQGSRRSRGGDPAVPRARSRPAATGPGPASPRHRAAHWPRGPGGGAERRQLPRRHPRPLAGGDARVVGAGTGDRQRHDRTRRHRPAGCLAALRRDRRGHAPRRRHGHRLDCRRPSEALRWTPCCRAVRAAGGAADGAGAARPLDDPRSGGGRARPRWRLVGLVARGRRRRFADDHRRRPPTPVGRVERAGHAVWSDPSR